MTIQKEGCPCSETSDPSNVDSLATNASSNINSSELSDNSARQYVNTNEKMIVPPPTRETTSPNVGQPPPVNHQPQKGPFQPSTQFEPAMQCLCHAYRVKQIAIPMKYSQCNAERFHWKWPKKEFAKRKDKLYELKVKRNHYRHYSKPNSGEDGTEGIPKKKKDDSENTTEAETKQYPEVKRDQLEEITERIDIYYFDHGNSAYYRTTDSPPVLATEKCAEKTDYAATRFWAEIFGTIHIGISFVTAFILQFFRFVLFSIVRPLTVGILQLFADYFVKPLLSIFFNAVIQPILILLYNIATSIRDLCEPIAEALGFFLREVAAVVRAFRIVEVNPINNQQTTSCT